MFPHQLYRRAQVLQAKRVIEFTATRLVCLVAWNAVNQTNKIHAAFLQGSGGFLQSFCVAFLYVCGSTWLCSSCRGQSGHSVTTDGQEKPRGHLKSHRQCSLHTVCVYACVALSILVFQSKCVCDSTAQLTEAVQPPSHATNAIPVCLGFTPNHQISHTLTHIYTNIHIQACTHELTHTHLHTQNMAKQKQISQGPERPVQHQLN